MSYHTKREIFEGRILHFQDKPGGMLVDWFKGDDIKKLYFISHAHTDHLNGLAINRDKKFCGRLSSSPGTKIYCTRVTADLILRLPGIVKNTELKDEVEKHFEILERNGETDINFCDKDGNPSGEHMTVRTIPANHIPGAVMFLFDDGIKRALYTGDFRYDVREIYNEEMSALKEFVETYDGILDYLYVDVTCLDLGRLYHPDQNKLPSKSQIKKKVCREIEKRGVTTVHLDAGALGAEEMVKAVAERFNNPVGDILERLPDGCHRYDLYEYLLKDIKCTGSTCNTTLHMSPESSFDEKFSCKFCKEDSLKIRVGLEWVFKSYQYEYSFDNRDTWTSPNNDSKKVFQAIFSHHSSDRELRKFLRHLKFKDIYPISIPFDRNFRNIYYKPVEDIAPEIKHIQVRDGVRHSIESSSLMDWRYINLRSHSVLYLSTVDKSHINLANNKLIIHKGQYRHVGDILTSITRHWKNYKPTDFVIISCSTKLSESLGQLYSNLYKFIDDLWNCVDGTKAVIFYSTTLYDENNQYKQIIDRNRRYRPRRRTFYLDLTKTAAYTEADCKEEKEVEILQETLSNIVRNQNREVFVSDWPMPYEYSERKREYDLAKQKPEEEEGEQGGEEEERKCESEEELVSQEVEMTEPE